MSFEEVLISALEVMRQSGRVFCSEADFQQQLAFEINKLICFQDSANEVRLEYPIGAMHIDILVTYEGGRYPIELKYKTQTLEADGFSLRNQSARDNACYDFLRDIERIEGMVAKDSKQGFAILLTNDPWYFHPSEPRKGTFVEPFRMNPDLHNKPATKNGCYSCDWEGGSGRSRNINLTGTYKMVWQVFNTGTGEGYSEFQILVVKVDRPLTQRS